jgi:HEAT repeat protein
MVMRRKANGAKGLRKPTLTLGACCIWLIFGTSPAFPQTFREKAWEILQAGLSESRTSNRAAAVGALGLLQGDPRAIEAVEKALGDRKPAVRAAAATALGQMGARSSIPLLKEALADRENRVFFAAADSLLVLGDPAGYDLYYEILTGERKSGENWFAEKKKVITDTRAVVLLGLGVGIGFAPYAGYGWMVFRELSKDYGTPVRIRALKKLENDSDSRIGQALMKAAGDKHWTVRVAALSAIARHGDPSLICQITPFMSDKKIAVRYTAAAAVIRLLALGPLDETAHMARAQ